MGEKKDILNSKFEREGDAQKTASAVEKSDDLVLSATMMSVQHSFAKKDKIDAIALVKAILQRHPEYGGDTKFSLDVHETEISGHVVLQTVEEWLNDVRALFDQKHVPRLHGRLVIIGLSLLQPSLHRELSRNGFFDAITNELKEPLNNILTQRGWLLLQPPDSVANLPDDPQLTLQNDQLGRAAFARFLAKRLSAVPGKAAPIPCIFMVPGERVKARCSTFLK